MFCFSVFSFSFFLLTYCLKLTFHTFVSYLLFFVMLCFFLSFFLSHFLPLFSFFLFFFSPLSLSVVMERKKEPVKQSDDDDAFVFEGRGSNGAWRAEFEEQIHGVSGF